MHTVWSDEAIRGRRKHNWQQLSIFGRLCGSRMFWDRGTVVILFFPFTYSHSVDSVCCICIPWNYGIGRKSCYFEEIMNVGISPNISPSNANVIFFVWAPSQCQLKLIFIVGLHKYSSRVYEACIQSFCALPITALVDGRFFCVHGGISPLLLELSDVNKVRFCTILSSTSQPGWSLR